jgi:diacylglycerol kinase (ATP)
MRVTLIHNPGAGDDDQPGPEEIQRLVRAAGHQVIYQSCKDAQWAAALDRPCDLVAVAGGDGTLGRVAKRLAGKAVPLTALPMGTANNISRTLGLVDVPTERLIAGWSSGHRLRLDIGLARGPWGSSRFVEAAGIGLFAWTMPEADENPTLANLDQADRKIAYALQMLKDHVEHCPPIELEAELDGRDLSGAYVMLEVMNTHYVGPNLYLAPRADPTDGGLDVVLVRETERARLLDYLSSWQNGRMQAPELPTYRGRKLRIGWTGFHAHVDDTLWPADGQTIAEHSGTIEISIGRDDVHFLRPAGLPDWRAQGRQAELNAP